MQTKTIVIGTSLAPGSDDIVRMGVAVARATGATPWLAHGYTLELLPTPFGPLDLRFIGEQEATLRAALVRQAERTGLADLPGFAADRIQLTADAPDRAIVDLAQRVAADLIVVGAHEGGALHRLLLGSTADGVIHRAPCPVLVGRSPESFPPARVEVAVDLSPVSAQALRQGLAFLDGLGVDRGETEALFVLSPLEIASSLHFSSEQIERFAREELRRFLDENGAALPLVQMRCGYPWEEIVAALKERRADLLILGTHGRHGFERLLLGSVAFEVLHKASCNLLVVPPGTALAREAAEEKREEVFGGDWGFISDADSGARVAAAAS
jgi:universal stress protein E